MTRSTFDVAEQARLSADAAAARAAVRVVEAHETPDLRAVSTLFEQVWGRTDEGVPLSSELLRALVHAGGAVTVARRADGELAGASALVIAADDSTYSLIAAVRPGGADRGIGQALKLRQRQWSLDRGLTTMRWTFDPLVGRNARFNLTKLGATADEYLVSFYGRMSDQINAGDDSDRLVACWRLDAPRTVSASDGTVSEPDEPDLREAVVGAVGPDAKPAHVTTSAGTWCRVPHDIVELRRTSPAVAVAWRRVVRDAFTSALDAGLAATGVTRTGWYSLTPRTKGSPKGWA